MEWMQKATESTEIVQQCLSTFEEIVKLLEKVDWKTISDGIRKIVGSMKDCTEDAAKLIGEISEQYIRLAKDYSCVTEDVRKECLTTSNLLHMYLDDMPTSGGNAGELRGILPEILKTLCDAIEKSNNTIQEISDGFGTSYGTLVKLKTILEGGLEAAGSGQNNTRNILATISMVIGCMAAGGIVGLAVSGGICWAVGAAGTTASAITGTVTGIGAFGGGAFGYSLNEGHREHKDIRKMIEENLDRLKKVEQQIRQLLNIIPDTRREYTPVESAAQATEMIRKFGSDDRLIEGSRHLMIECDNYTKTNHKLILQKW